MSDERKHVTTYDGKNKARSGTVTRAINLYKTDGITRVLRGCWNFVKWRWWLYVSTPVYLRYYQNFKSDTFVFNGQTYEYFYHQHNETWRNERTIEVPIVYNIVCDYPAESILEIGNVLSHYYDCSHEVVDKYEQSEGIINEDIVQYDPGRKYELIVSISTLEHVGYDEESASSEKLLEAFDNLRSLLTADGQAVITLPLGYNLYLDELIRKDALFSEKHYFERTTADNRWREVETVDINSAQFDVPYKGANELIVGEVH
jgi:hypothetical protein